MEYSTDNDDDNGKNGSKPSIARARLPLLAALSLGLHGIQGRPRPRAGRMTLRIMGRRNCTRKIERQQRKQMPRHHHLQRALTAVFSVATMRSFVPVPKSLGSLDLMLTKRVLPILPPPKQHQQEPITGLPATLRYRPCSPVLGKRPREREDPCSFRTRLMDGGGAADGESEVEFGFDSTDKLDADDVKFDDTQCIEVNRSPQKFAGGRGVAPFQAQEPNLHEEPKGPNGLGPHLFAVPVNETNESPASDLDVNEPLAATVGHQGMPRMIPNSLSDPTSSHPNNFLEDSDDENEMESMNMPFWDMMATKKRPRGPSSHSRTNIIPDDMSIITDISQIPAYYPSDVINKQPQQQWKGSRRRAVLKHLFVAKAKSARQTMRHLKRSCREVVMGHGHACAAEADAAAYRPTPCVPVGSVY